MTTSPDPVQIPSLQLPGRRAWVAVIGVGLTLLLLFAALLVSLRLEKALTDLVEARTLLMARQLADAVEGGLRFGVPLADQTETPRKMAALSKNDPDVQWMVLLDERGKPVVKHTADGVSDAVETRQVLRLLSLKTTALAEPPRRVWLEGHHVHALMQVRDATGFVSGAVWVAYTAREPQVAFAQSLWTLSLWAVALAAGVTLLLWGLLTVMSLRTSRALDRMGEPEGTQTTPWPLLPVPQALRTLKHLENELTSFSPPTQRGDRT